MLSWRLALKLSAVFGVVALVFVGYRYVVNLQEQVVDQSAVISSLETAIDANRVFITAQDEALANWNKAHNDLIARVEQLDELYRQAASEVTRLNDIFSDHDLGRLALARPGLIERRVNAGTADAGRLLECASGSGRPDCDPPAPGNPGASEP